VNVFKSQIRITNCAFHESQKKPSGTWEIHFVFPCSDPLGWEPLICGSKINPRRRKK